MSAETDKKQGREEAATEPRNPAGQPAAGSPMQDYLAARKSGKIGWTQDAQPGAEEAGPEDDTGTSPESEGDTGTSPESEGDTGTPPESGGTTEADPGKDAARKGTDDEGKRAGRLSKGMARRVNRAVRQRDEAEARVSELERELADLRSKLDSNAEGDKPADGGKQAEPKRGGDAGGGKDRDVAYPEEADYTNEKGEFDEEAYDEDVERWLNGQSPKRQPKPEAESEPEPADDGGRGERQAEGDPRAEAEARVKRLFRTVREILDTDEGELDLWRDFESVRQDPDNPITYPMLQYLAENEDDTILLVSEFVERPRSLRRIYDKSESDPGKTSKAMGELAEAIRQRQAKRESDAEKSARRQSDIPDTSEVPNKDASSGQDSRGSSKAGADKFAAYKAHRLGEERRKREEGRDRAA